ncbi:MAG: ethylbenzene dehydrogenase-related protein [Sulfurovaceae bacterium]|nr:ethylbenzene dehydrogenase-related protein [Sulfurovaceae bacterium]
MNKLLKSIIIAGLVTASYAKTTTPATMVSTDGLINAQRVGNINISTISPSDGIWSKAKTTTIILYPQQTIKLNDAKANKLNAANLAKKVKVSAIYSSNAVAFKLVWSDPTQDKLSGIKSDMYGDGFAMQVPVSFNDPKKLPYIGMGSDGRPVVVSLTKAVTTHYEPNGNGNVENQLGTSNMNLFGDELKQQKAKIASLGNSQYVKSFVSEGFRSMTEIKDGSAKVGMKMSYDSKTKQWTGVVAKSLNDGTLHLGGHGALPISFAIWDGGKMNRGGIKNISSWVAVKLQGKSGDDALVKELTTPPSGNAIAGKAQVEAMCAACHTLSDTKKAANAYMAPNLKDIGGYSTNAYLAESIKDPNAVVVPGYNKNAHKSMIWYNADPKTGKRTTTMPPMMTDDKMINDAVAYLKTLKAGVEK